jgi:hypothetical protein
MQTVAVQPVKMMMATCCMHCCTSWVRTVGLAILADCCMMGSCHRHAALCSTPSPVSLTMPTLYLIPIRSPGHASVCCSWLDAMFFTVGPHSSVGHGSDTAVAGGWDGLPAERPCPSVPRHSEELKAVMLHKTLRLSVWVVDRASPENVDHLPHGFCNPAGMTLQISGIFGCAFHRSFASAQRHPTAEEPLPATSLAIFRHPSYLPFFASRRAATL